MTEFKSQRGRRGLGKVKISNSLKKAIGELPWWSKVKNPSCSGGDTGLIPDWRTRIPQAVEQLSPRA